MGFIRYIVNTSNSVYSEVVADRHEVEMIRNPFLIFSMVAIVLSGCHDIDFDSEKWKNWIETESNMNMRWDMVDDLIDNYNLKGKSIEELEQLLGEAPLECPNKECVIYYNLGPCRRGIDYGSLMIEFKNGKVSNVEKYCN